GGRGGRARRRAGRRGRGRRDARLPYRRLPCRGPGTPASPSPGRVTAPIPVLALGAVMGNRAQGVARVSQHCGKLTTVVATSAVAYGPQQAVQAEASAANPGRKPLPNMALSASVADRLLRHFFC